MYTTAILLVFLVAIVLVVIALAASDDHSFRKHIASIDQSVKEIAKNSQPSQPPVEEVIPPVSVSSLSSVSEIDLQSITINGKSAYEYATSPAATDLLVALGAKSYRDALLPELVSFGLAADGYDNLLLIARVNGELGISGWIYASCDAPVTIGVNNLIATYRANRFFSLGGTVRVDDLPRSLQFGQQVDEVVFERLGQRVQFNASAIQPVVEKYTPPGKSIDLGTIAVFVKLSALVLGVSLVGAVQNRTWLGTVALQIEETGPIANSTSAITLVDSDYDGESLRIQSIYPYFGSSTNSVDFLNGTTALIALGPRE